MYILQGYRYTSVCIYYRVTGILVCIYYRVTGILHCLHTTGILVFTGVLQVCYLGRCATVCAAARSRELHAASTSPAST